MGINSSPLTPRRINFSKHEIAAPSETQTDHHFSKLKRDDSPPPPLQPLQLNAMLAPGRKKEDAINEDLKTAKPEMSYAQTQASLKQKAARTITALETRTRELVSSVIGKEYNNIIEERFGRLAAGFKTTPEKNHQNGYTHDKGVKLPGLELEPSTLVYHCWEYYNNALGDVIDCIYAFEDTDNQKTERVIDLSCSEERVLQREEHNHTLMNKASSLPEDIKLRHKPNVTEELVETCLEHLLDNSGNEFEVLIHSLNLSGNGIKQLPSSIKSLLTSEKTPLKALNLSNNALTALPEWFTQNPPRHLGSLDLSGNEIPEPQQAKIEREMKTALMRKRSGSRLKII